MTGPMKTADGKEIPPTGQAFDLDFYTVGRNYAREVLDRAGFFEAHGWD